LHSLKYVAARHWLRSHTRFVVILAVVVGVVIYVAPR
jgi:hypothetical protein